MRVRPGDAVSVDLSTTWGGGTVVDIFVALAVTPQQLGVRARVWHPMRSSCRTLVAVLLDIGAGGGNFSRAMHLQSCWKRPKGGDSAWGAVA